MVAGTSTAKSFAGNGSTTTYYPLAPEMEIAATTEVQGTADGVALTNGVDFTVDLANGVLTTATHPASTELIFYRVTPLTQPTDLPASETPPGTTVEAALDRLLRQIQEAAAAGARAVRGAIGETLTDLPAAASRALKWLHFDSSGQPEVYTDAQLAALVATELGISSGAVADAGTKTLADATARVATAPDRTGQLAVQLDDGTVWRGTGLTAGAWVQAVRSPSPTPVSSTAWLTATDYETGDYVTHVGLTWLCLKDHTSASIDEPRTGAAWKDRWRIHAEKGVHWDYKRDACGREVTDYVMFGPASLLPDWSPLIDYLQTFIGLEVGGGSNNAAWMHDNTPYADPAAWLTATAYVAGDFRRNDGANYKCIVNHTSGALDDEPGTGAVWESYWILWPFDYRRSWTMEFGTGPQDGPAADPYLLSETAKHPAYCIVRGQPGGTTTEFKPDVTVFPENDFLWAGVYRDGTDSNSSFFCSMLDVRLNQANHARALHWVCSHGSRLRVECAFGEHREGVIIGNNADDYFIESLIFVGGGGDWSRNLFCQGEHKGMYIGCLTLTNTATGIWFQGVHGGIVNVECEHVDMPIIVGMPAAASHIYPAWSDAAPYVRNTGSTHTSRLFWCFRAHDPAAVAAAEPINGADWEDYWIETTGQTGSCNGLTVVGSFRRASGDGDCIARVTGNYSSFDISGGLKVESAAESYTHYAFEAQTGAPNPIWDIPLIDAATTGEEAVPLNHGRTTAGFSRTLAADKRNMHRWAASTPAGSATNFAKEVDDRWVTNNNPATLVADGTTAVSMIEGSYIIEVVGTDWEAATLTIDDEDGNPLVGFNAISANKERRYEHPGGSLDVVVAGVSVACDIDIYFKPVMR